MKTIYRDEIKSPELAIYQRASQLKPLEKGNRLMADESFKDSWLFDGVWDSEIIWTEVRATKDSGLNFEFRIYTYFTRDITVVKPMIEAGYCFWHPYAPVEMDIHGKPIYTCVFITVH